jgi:hypothetical protein
MRPLFYTGSTQRTVLRRSLVQLMTTTANSQPADSPEVKRRYNRVQRWLSLADTVIGLALLVVLLVTGWTGKLRDWSLTSARAALFSRRISLRADVFRDRQSAERAFRLFGFRLEHQYHLSNQKLRGWLWDECKGWLVSLVLGTIMVEIIIRHHSPRAAALVDHRVGRLCRTVSADGTARAGHPDAHLLQVRAAGK